MTMKKLLTIENLMNTWANPDGTMDLEFQTDGKSYIVRNVVAPEAATDEDYWDKEENVTAAVEAADESDIEVK